MDTPQSTAIAQQQRVLAPGWITIPAAVTQCRYTAQHLRILAASQRIEAEKLGRQWLLYLPSLRRYATQMERLGTAKHDPWRAALTHVGRGRNH